MRGAQRRQIRAVRHVGLLKCNRGTARDKNKQELLKKTTENDEYMKFQRFSNKLSELLLGCRGFNNKRLEHWLYCRFVIYLR